MKTCARCKKEKPFSEFCRNARYKDGHGSWCKQCHKERGREWSKENRERLNKKAKIWRSKNPESNKKAYTEWRDRNPEKVTQKYRDWRHRNLEYDRARAAKRKAQKIQATPPWVDLDEVADFYRRTPRGLEVDHIVPLTSDYVCGLHCMANLQYLTPSENQSKRNFWWPDMPDCIAAAYAQGRLFA